MIVLGALVVGTLLALHACATFGLVFARRWLAEHRAADPDAPAHAIVREALDALILALVLAPFALCFLYVPIVEVSADGQRELGIVKPRIIEDLGNAAWIALIASGAIATLCVLACHLFRRTPTATK
jgi:hypothetical protein